MTRHELPRVTMLLMLTLAGALAFLTSRLWLDAGLESMALRYPIAAFTGYLGFIVLVRIWISVWRRTDPVDALDALDLADLGSRADVDTVVDTHIAEAFGGGQSGGAGASASWAGASHGSAHSPIAEASRASAGEAVGGALDVDEIWYLVVLAGVGFVAFIAIGFVVYSAPLLLAEIAVDAALVGGAYSRIRQRDVRHWGGTLLRRTWLPAAAVIATMAVAGYVMQRLAPDATSIGGVMRHLTN